MGHRNNYEHRIHKVVDISLFMHWLHKKIKVSHHISSGSCSQLATGGVSWSVGFFSAKIKVVPANGELTTQTIGHISLG